MFKWFKPETAPRYKVVGIALADHPLMMLGSFDEKYGWIDYYTHKPLDNVLAWCELPTFTGFDDEQDNQ